MSLNDRKKSQLIANIYDAALNPAQWQTVLQEIQTLCGTDQCTLFFYDAACRSRNYASAARISSDSIQTYLEHFIDAQAADINNRLKHLPEGIVVSANDIHAMAKTSYEELVGHEYMDKAWPNLQFQAGIVLLRSTHVCAGLGLQSFKHSPSISENQLALLQELAIHFVRAIKIHQEISNARQNQKALANIIGNIHQGVLLLDSDLRLLSSNNEAMRIIEKTGIFYINQHNQLSTAKNLEQSAVATLFAQLKTGDHQDSQVLPIDCNNLSPIKLRLFTIKKTSDFALSRDPAHLILLHDPNRDWLVPNNYLEDAYSLTETECELLQYLLNGDSINDAATQCHISLETARWRLKKILKKTNTHSQAELSRLVLNLCD